MTITDDIDKDIDYPLAIIALADGEGHGGNIIIDSSVKDITA